MRAMCHKCRNEVDEWEYGHDGYFYCFKCADEMKKEARAEIRKKVRERNENKSNSFSSIRSRRK